MSQDKQDMILEFKGVSKWFPGVRALNDVSFGVRRGSVHCIVGENGAGKSTLLKIIDGLYRKDAGEILFDGRAWEPSGSADARRSGIAMIHQELNIIPEMTVAENMFLGREIPNKVPISLNDRRMIQETAGYLKQQNLPYKPTAKMKDLAIAEAQMVEILKAISIDAKIILMDEPTSSLTEKEVEFLFEKIEELRAAGITIIYISHRMNELFRIGDYVSIFRDGEHIETGRMGEYTHDTVIEKMVGRKMSEVYPERTAKPGEEILRVEGLCRQGIFQDVSFSLRSGEILGVSGLVGAGRSEIARSMIGLDPKNAGRVVLEGKELRIHNVNDSIRAGIAMVSEDRRRFGLVMQQSIRENISLVALLHRFKRWVLRLSSEKKLVDEMVQTLSIKAPSSNTRVGTLSGGNQQKVVLSKWLAVSPKVLIMDEPTRGIDVKTKFEIYKLMNDMTGQGMSILMINSDMEELLGMSDRVLVIREGRVAGELEGDALNAESVMHLAVEG